MPIDVAFDQRGLSRRVVLATTSMALVGIASPHLAIAALTPTPRQTAGPFYPKSLPLHPDNEILCASRVTRSKLTGLSRTSRVACSMTTGDRSRRHELRFGNATAMAATITLMIDHHARSIPISRVTVRLPPPMTAATAFARSGPSPIQGARPTSISRSHHQVAGVL
jgi:hypothetical protein